MLRRTTISAALAALAVPLALAAPPATAIPAIPAKPVRALPANADPAQPLASLPANAVPAQPLASLPATAIPGAATIPASPATALAAASVQTASARPVATEPTPLAVTIDELTPSTIPARGVIGVSGQVTNRDSVTWSRINVYSFISDEPMTTSSELEAAAATDESADVGGRITDEAYRDTIPELAPGASARFSFSVPRKRLAATTGGVYWFGVHALGENDAGRDEMADGRARTFLPLIAQRSTGRLPVALVLSLRHQLLHNGDGSLSDLDGWLQTLAEGGRLRSLVEFGADAGGRPVNWVVDPGLVDAVRRLAAGNPPRSIAANLAEGQADGESTQDATPDPSGTGSPAAANPSYGPGSDTATPEASPGGVPTGSGTPAGTGQEPEDLAVPELDSLDAELRPVAQAAREWLTILGPALDSGEQVLTLPYGDVDVAGAAAHDPRLLQRALDRSGPGLVGFDVPTAPVVSSPSGLLSQQALAQLGPDVRILLSDQMLAPAPPDQDDPDSDGAATESDAGTIASQNQLRALAGVRASIGSAAPPAAITTADHRVVITSSGAAAGGPGPGSPTSVNAMRQRMLAEAAVRFLSPDQQPLTLVVPHDWNPSTGGSAFFAGLAVPWLDLESVDEVAAAAAAPAVTPSALRYPGWQASSELGATSFEAAERLMASGEALQSMLTLNNRVSGTIADQAFGSVSYSARSRPVTSRAQTEASRDWIGERLDAVRVSTTQAVTLFSTSGRFAATVVNGLDQPVTIALDARSDGRITITGPRRVDIAANSRKSVLLTTSTTANGIHDVRLLVTDKRGTPLGSSTGLAVRSAQVSNLIWLLMGIGALLLLIPIVVRLFRRVRDARRTAQPAAPNPAPNPAGRAGVR